MPATCVPSVSRRAHIPEAVPVAAAHEALRVLGGGRPRLPSPPVPSAQLARVGAAGGGQPAVHVGRLAHEVGQAVVHAERAADGDDCAAVHAVTVKPKARHTVPFASWCCPEVWKATQVFSCRMQRDRPHECGMLPLYAAHATVYGRAEGEAPQ